MTKPLEAQFYFGAVIDHDGECQRVSAEEAQFWTVYERNADGLSSAICDCTHRDDAVAATERFNALIAALEQSQQYAKDRDAENQDLMLTVGRLRVEREQSSNALLDAGKRIAELEASHSQVIQARDHYKSLVSASQLAVKLPEKVHFNPACGIQQMLINCTHNAAIDACAEAIRAAGGTVQGDE